MMKIMFALFAMFGLALGTVAITGAVHAADNTHYGSQSFQADGGQG